MNKAPCLSCCATYWTWLGNKKNISLFKGAFLLTHYFFTDTKSQVIHQLMESTVCFYPIISIICIGIKYVWSSVFKQVSIIQIGNSDETLARPLSIIDPAARHQFRFVCLCAVIQNYDYVFAENGLVAYKNGQLLGVQVRCTWGSCLTVLKLLYVTVSSVLKAHRRLQVEFVCFFSPFRIIWEKNCFSLSSTSVWSTWPTSSCPGRGPSESPSSWRVCVLIQFLVLMIFCALLQGDVCWIP